MSLGGVIPPVLVIFDCDGVLVDSEPTSNGCFARAVASEGLTWDTSETMRRLMGRSMASCLEIIERELGRPVTAGFVQHFQTELLATLERAGVPAVRGVVEALDIIERRGCLTCVASSGEHEKMAVTLGSAGLLSRFSGRIFSATEVARGKPAPDLFLHAAERMGINPAQCVVVEDSPPGVVGARAAGMRVLGYVGAPYADHTAMQVAGAELFVSMEELPPRLGLLGT